MLRDMYLLGVLSDPQIREHYYKWTTRTKRYPQRKKMEKSTYYNRMRLLVQAGFIQKLSRGQLMEQPVPSMVYWLGVKGIAFICSERGVDDNFSRTSLHAQKRLAESLRRRPKPIIWKPTPDWLRVKHSIEVADLYFVAKAAAEQAGLIWDKWVPESTFRHDPPWVTYIVRRRDRQGEMVEEERREKLFPDGFFRVLRPVEDQGKVVAGEESKAEPRGYFVELDRSTEDNPRFARTRVMPGEALILSKSLRKYTGLNSSRWIVATTGEERAKNMKWAAERVSARKWFYFCSTEQLRPETFFGAKIWHLTNVDTRIDLLSRPKPGNGSAR
jgi:hypothetical protein